MGIGTAFAVEKMLQRRGLPTDFGEAIKALARSIRDHRNLESLLTTCSATERRELYEAVVPHLRFTAKPLDVYVAEAGQRAEREQLPVVGVDGKLKPFTPAADVNSVQKHTEELLAQTVASRTLRLTCSKCTVWEDFHMIGEETAVAVRLKALKNGWTLFPREICPTCTEAYKPN